MSVLRVLGRLVLFLQHLLGEKGHGFFFLSKINFDSIHFLLFRKFSNYFWCKEGWEVEDNPVGTAFEVFWMFFEPCLFGVYHHYYSYLCDPYKFDVN